MNPTYRPRPPPPKRSHLGGLVGLQGNGLVLGTEAALDRRHRPGGKSGPGPLRRTLVGSNVSGSSGVMVHVVVIVV